jgi:hypothetical protein
MQTEKETPRPPLSEAELIKEIEHLTNDELTARTKMLEKNISAMNVEQKGINNRINDQTRKIEGNKKRVYVNNHLLKPTTSDTALPGQ